MALKVLRKGSTGPLVEAWQHFLIGEGARLKADGDFGNRTVRATKAWQKKRRLRPVDGIVGNRSYGVAMSRGFSLVEDLDDTRKSGPNWPPPPTPLPRGRKPPLPRGVRVADVGLKFLKPPSRASRKRLYGRFKFKPAPSPRNPERIRIIDPVWRRNIIKVEIPQLEAIGRAPHMWAHRKVADSLQHMWAAWEKARLLDRVVTFNGSYSTRYIRGSRTTLSNHSWGTAFDINARWNKLGKVPALVGETGSVRELVKIANRHGWWWGGHYKRRKDGMHFEKGIKV